MVRNGRAQKGRLGVTFVLVAAPSLITLIPMATSSAMPSIASRFGGSEDGIFLAQFVMTCPALMLAIGAVAFGYLSEKFGRRRCLLSLLVAFAVFGVAGAVAPDAVILIATRLVLGGVGGGILTVSMALAGQYRRGGEREQLLGMVGAGEASLAMVALVMAGVLVDCGGWRAPFTLYLSALVVWVVAICALDEDDVRDHVEHKPTRPFEPQIILYVLTGGLGIALFVPGVQGPFLLEDLGISSATSRSVIVASSSLAAAIAGILYSRVRCLVDPLPLLAVAALMLGGGTAAMGMAPSAGLATGGALVVGFGAGLVGPVASTIVLGRAGEAHLGRAAGYLIGSVFLGEFFNPLFLGPLRGKYGAPDMFVIVGTSFVMLALIMVMYSGRPTDQAPG
ncbi:MFS transporter [Paraburkholderia sacchari]|uniref:MFS transporter n=1 Tax=Paraburkholderia sacchari TaxID=159450 RepID=UPI000542E0A1|nr:MFS transporter [Paraburkholderia sacchari]NLP64891.1 MFS transporter [Paraburkholderia sacchari]